MVKNAYFGSMASDLKEKFLAYVAENELFNKEDRLLVGVSGGVDSMVLCHLLLHEDITFQIAHVNYHLRKEASNGDEFFLRKYGQTYFIPVHVKNVTRAPDENTQNWARKIRYAYFEEILHQEKLDAILTAHHFDDQIETLILNFTRGSGISGIKGIASSRGLIKRPLLFARKSEILDYAKEQGISWREDATNSEDHYKRNIIRHHITPHLDTLRANDLGMRRTFSQIKQLDRWLRSHFSEILQSYRQENGEWHIPLADYHAEQSTFELFQLLKNLNFNLDQVESMIESSRTGSQFHSDTHMAIVDRDVLLIRKKIAIHYEEKEINDFNEDFSISIGNREIRFSKQAGNKVEKSHSRSYFDVRHLSWPLTIRRWRNGDRFQPFGMYGKTKKISDLHTHMKLSFFEKEETLVLVDSNEQILWVIGLRRAMHAPVLDDTPGCVVIDVV